MAGSLVVGLAVTGAVVWQSGADIRSVATRFPLSAHLLALLASTTDLVARGARFSLLARGMGLSLGVWPATAATVSGEAAGAVTPSRAGAHPAKVAVMVREGLKVRHAAALLVGEALLEATVSGVFAVPFWFLAPEIPLAWVGALGYAGMSVLAVMAAVAVALLPTARAPRVWTRLGRREGAWQKLRRGSRGFLARSRKLAALPLGMLAALLAVTAVHLLARLAVLPALTPLPAEPGATAPLIAWPFLLMYFGSLVPVPGGGGAVEAGFAASLAQSVPRDVLGEALIWWRFYTFYLPALAGAVVLIWMGGRAATKGNAG